MDGDDMEKFIVDAFKRVSDAQDELMKPKIICLPPGDHNLGRQVVTTLPVVPAQMAAAEYCEYLGKRCRVISKNYQTGVALIEGHDPTGPFTIEVQLGQLIFKDSQAKSYSNKCECGVDAIGGGRHSEYCPKHNTWD